MMAKPMKTLELHYPIIQFLIMFDIPVKEVRANLKIDRNTAKIADEIKLPFSLLFSRRF